MSLPVITVIEITLNVLFPRLDISLLCLLQLQFKNEKLRYDNKKGIYYILLYFYAVLKGSSGNLINFLMYDM